MENIYAQRIAALRSLMRQKGWDAVCLTGSDPHGSEYPAPRWKQVEWLTGFTGEAGDIVVTLTHAGLWTDTRYFIQAVQQLEGTGVVLHKTRVPEQVLIPEWLSSEAFPDRGRCVNIAVDGLCQRVSAMKELKSSFGEEDPDEPAVRIISVPDILDELWSDRPAIPQTPVITLSEAMCGESRASKLSWLRAVIARKSCDAILLTALDDIAWMLNVRGSDIEYNPLVISYLLVTASDAKWFVCKDIFEAPDPQTLDSFAELEDDGIRVLPYDDIALALSQEEPSWRIYADPSSLNYHLGCLLQQYNCIFGDSPVQLRKAIKNETEIANMRKAHFVDGIAMEKFLYWLEAEVSSGRKVTEWDASVRLGAYRSEIEGYMGDSFETISAYGPGAALPHYVTPRSAAPVLEPRGLYLCDSGGQYLYGTTDITRTVPLGECTPLEKEDYTLVLKGHIALAMAVFPQGTAGCQIDLLARDPLWKAKRNFGHGTGHGIGFFLGVHEGPQDIRQNFNSQPLLPGMITSDEPGIYREGKHGVRHENLILCREAGSNGFGKWLEFETLTLCHFDTSAVIADMLSPQEREWLNDYNARVYDSLSDSLPPEVAVWLKEKTAPI